MEDKILKINQIINDYKNRSNNDLLLAMNFLNDDFELTKKTLLQLTNHLDYIESEYNKLLNEYKLRTNGK